MSLFEVNPLKVRLVRQKCQTPSRERTSRTSVGCGKMDSESSLETRFCWALEKEVVKVSKRMEIICFVFDIFDMIFRLCCFWLLPKLAGE